MLAAARSVANSVSAEELAGLAFLYISEINLCQVDTILTKEKKNEFDLAKVIKLTALELFSALAPQKTIDLLIKEQIVKAGQYEEYAYTILTLRYVFIKSYIL